ncbi:MAG: hypothetical protein K5905_22705 [Roseibium sp.]|uniref:TfuA-like protein n=1 Tax=Roseibium sp. TaxID=1936156 RepID=UPI002629C331|nr:TfuA-like protein [Roseibium sp.]MCV0428277.1 hypothetical protein [Roseibium sp.]
MASTKIVFAGPSFAGSQIEYDPEISFRPPCKQGDIYLACKEKPSVIGIVDGYFEGVPSVWHKEILWALSQGVHVIGAASMGALRAAETDRYGIGAVYEGYRDGILEDDDEVALLHGPAEMDFIPLSLAMVNVRATLKGAVDGGVISQNVSDFLLKAAKDRFYKERTWENLLSDWEVTSSEGAPVAEFRSWLADNEVDQKRLDAESLYRFVSEQNFAVPYNADFVFEETEYWHQCIREWGRQTRQSEQRQGSEGYRLFG